MDIQLLAELIERNYYGGDVSDDSGLERRDFVKHVASAYGYVFTKKVWDNYKTTGEKYVNEAKAVIAPIVYDSTREQYYAQLASSPLELPFGLGLQGVYPIASTTPYYMANAGDAFLYADMEGSPVIAFREVDKIYLLNLDPAVTQVRVLMVESEPADVPDECVEEIQQLVMQRLLKGKTIQEDKINNSSSNPPLQ